MVDGLRLGLLLTITPRPLVITASLQSPKPPIIVKLVEPRRDPTGLAHVLVGALGLTAALTLLAVLLGVALAGVMFWVRSRQS